MVGMQITFDKGATQTVMAGLDPAIYCGAHAAWTAG